MGLSEEVTFEQRHENVRKGAMKRAWKRKIQAEDGHGQRPKVGRSVRCENGRRQHVGGRCGMR